MSDQTHRFEHRLRSKHTVEGVSVSPSEAAREKRVILSYRQPLDTQPIQMP
jgi:hypothetical protein